MSPCKWINLPGGGVAHLNMGHSKPKRCKFCSTGMGTQLCDFPLRIDTNGKIKTCDAPMCVRCATRIAIEVDYCPVHKDIKPEAAKAQGDLPL